MRRARERREPLDVDDAQAPGPDGGGDARHLPEAVVAEVVHGEAVHLADARAGRLHEDQPFADVLAEPPLLDAHAPRLGLDGLEDVLPPDPLGPVAARGVVRLAHEVGHAAEAHRQAPAPARLAHPLLGHRGEARAVEVEEALLLRELLEEGGVVVERLLRQGRVALEGRLHLEDLGEVGVGVAQAPPGGLVPDQDHLHVDRDRVGVEDGRARGHHRLGQPDLEPPVL